MVCYSVKRVLNLALNIEPVILSDSLFKTRIKIDVADLLDIVFFVPPGQNHTAILPLTKGLIKLFSHMQKYTCKEKL